jgi:hypothetical protein
VIRLSTTAFRQFGRVGRSATASSHGSHVVRLIVGLGDAITLADVALRAYEQAPQSKKLVVIAGGHFDPYLNGFDESSTAACTWFTQHLTDRSPIALPRKGTRI